MTFPAGASVQIDGRDVGKAPYTWKEPDVRGSVDVTVSKAGYATKTETVEFLAVDFLSALLHLFLLERLLIREVRVLEITEKSVDAEVSGEFYSPGRHELGPEIKAITYHHLKVAREGKTWRAEVLLDL